MLRVAYCCKSIADAYVKKAAVCGVTCRAFSLDTTKQTDTSANDIRHEILKLSLKHVPTYGFTKEALENGTRDADLSVASASMFERGPVELVEFHLKEALHSTRNDLQKREEYSRLRKHDKMRLVIRTRLEKNTPYISHWPQAVGLQCLPHNLPYALQNKAILADELAYLSGDRSSDIHWYAKRAAILGIYGSTELCMLTDKSEGFVQTWEFLDRRVQDAVELKQRVDDASDIGGATLGGVQSIIGTLGRSLTGRL